MMMIFLPKDSALSTSFAAMILLSVAGFLLLMAISPHSHSANAFQLHSRCMGRRQIACSSVTFAARHGDETASLPAKVYLKSGNCNNQVDIAKVWANSLEDKIPWHASSRQYLSSEGSFSDSSVPSLLGENEIVKTKNGPHKATAP